MTDINTGEKEEEEGVFPSAVLCFSFPERRGEGCRRDPGCLGLAGASVATGGDHVLWSVPQQLILQAWLCFKTAVTMNIAAVPLCKAGGI